MSHLIIRIYVLIILALSHVLSYAQLSDTERQSLSYCVHTDYGFFGVEGTRVYNTGKNWVLVAIEAMQSQMNATAQGRAASMKATRDMAEFLKGASTKATSIYETRSEEMTSFDKKSKDNASAEGNYIESDITKAVNEAERSFSSEILDEKTIQKVSARVDGMQSLQKFIGPNGETVYVYYLVISKAKAKKKH